MRRSDEGNTAAHLACVQNNDDIVSLLLSTSCSWNMKNADNRTALDCTTDPSIQYMIITK